MEVLNAGLRSLDRVLWAAVLTVDDPEPRGCKKEPPSALRVKGQGEERQRGVLGRCPAPAGMAVISQDV